MVDNRDGVLVEVGCLRLRGGRGVIPSDRVAVVLDDDDDDGCCLRGRRGADSADRTMVDGVFVLYLLLVKARGAPNFGRCHRHSRRLQNGDDIFRQNGDVKSRADN